MLEKPSHRVSGSEAPRGEDGAHGTLRILLGIIPGGLLGVIWTKTRSIQLEGVTLSLAALAFFVGFSVEVVFQVSNGLVAKNRWCLSKIMYLTVHAAKPARTLINSFVTATGADGVVDPAQLEFRGRGRDRACSDRHAIKTDRAPDQTEAGDRLSFGVVGCAAKPGMHPLRSGVEWGRLVKRSPANRRHLEDAQ
jgi:hypothetical protein